MQQYFLNGDIWQNIYIKSFTLHIPSPQNQSVDQSKASNKRIQQDCNDSVQNSIRSSSMLFTKKLVIG